MQIREGGSSFNNYLIHYTGNQDVLAECLKIVESLFQLHYIQQNGLIEPEKLPPKGVLTIMG